MFQVNAKGLFVRAVSGLLGGVVILLAVLYHFNVVMMLEEFYLYILLALAIPILFFRHRARGTSDIVPWYDCLIALAGFLIAGYIALFAKEIYVEGWELGAPTPMMIAGFVLLLILLEGVRRTFGMIVFLIATFFVFEPIFAGSIPGPLGGLEFSFARVMSYHVYGHESVIGSVGATCGKILVGYLVFAGMLQASGGGRFFIDIALSMFGRSRGASAKVAVVGSGAFGMLSGAPIPNILTTGAFTIKSMIRMGYAPQYAAAVEACASTGGSLVPPVMGAAVFIMASMLELPYWDLCLAALLPAVVYYVLLFVQADAYAGRKGISGLKEDEIPKFKECLIGGIPYFSSVAVLFWFVAALRLESQAPFVAIIALVIVSMLRKSTRISKADFLEMFETAIGLMADIFILLYALGTLTGSLNLTGTAATLSFSMVELAGGSKILVPLLGAVVGYIMGVGVPAVALYIILSVTLAPALVAAGFPLVHSHMFCFYVGLLSFLVPPVALSSITAGKIAGVPSVFKVGFTSMRLGMGLFVMPFFFLLSPDLIIGYGPLSKTLISFGFTLFGMVLLAMAFERNIVRIKLRYWQAAVLGCLGGFIALVPALIL